jgi:hypothetical protein
MTVALRGSVTTATSTGSGLTINKPTGVIAGDVVVIWCLNGGGTAACTGFTTKHNANINFEDLLWRTADGSEGSSFSITGVGSGTTAVCAAFSGAAGGASFWDPNTPAAATAVGGNGSTPSFAGLENNAAKATVSDGDMLIWLLEAYGSGSPTITYPSGFVGTSQTSATITDTAALAYKVQATHGTTGTQAGSFTGLSSPQWQGNLLAIKASAAPVTITSTACAVPLGPLSINSTSQALSAGSGALPLGPLLINSGSLSNPCLRQAWLTLGSLSVPLQDESAGYFCTTLDLGYPSPREVTTNRPDQDGVTDRTKYLGSRLVSANITALRGAGARIDLVATIFAPFMLPSARPVLHYVLDRPGLPERTLTLRAAQFTYPISGPWQRDIHLQWVAADPIARDPVLKTAAAITLSPGSILTAGDVPIRPLFRITGPLTAAAILLTLSNPPYTSWLLAFQSSFTIAAGHFIEIDTDARTVFLDGDSAKPRLASIDWTVSSWQWIEPSAPTQMSLTGTGDSGTTRVDAFWQDGYLT